MIDGNYGKTALKFPLADEVSEAYHHLVIMRPRITQQQPDAYRGAVNWADRLVSRGIFRKAGLAKPRRERKVFAADN